MEKVGGTSFSVKSAGIQWSRVLFGRIAGLVPQLLPLLWLVESCMCILHVDVKLSRREPSAGAGGIPDFPGLVGLDVGDCALRKVDVEAQEVKVVRRDRQRSCGG